MKNNKVEQIDLFEGYNQNETKVTENTKPRSKEEPNEEILKNKNTAANATVFGFAFQIECAILLSLDYIKQIKNVKVEGNTEDIEIYLLEKEPIYVQVKSTSKSSDTFKDQSKFAAAAFDTLINTSNITNGKYSQLIYISNFVNPLNLNELDLNKYWIPSMKEIFIKSYGSLHNVSKEYLKGRFKQGIKLLEKGNYKSSTDYFEWDKFSIATVLMESQDSEENKHRILLDKIDSALYKINVRSSSQSARDVLNTLITIYLGNGSNKKVTITKKEILWTFYTKLCDLRSDNLDDIPNEYRNEIYDFEEGFINEQINRIDVINEITSKIEHYKSEKNKTRLTESEIKKYAESHWSDYKHLVPLDDTDIELQKYLIMDLILKIDGNKRVFKKIKDWCG